MMFCTKLYACLQLFLWTAVYAPAAPLGPSVSANLSWADTVNPAGTTYNIYRVAGTCPAAFSVIPAYRIASGISVDSYVDATVIVGSTYCYAVTAVFSSVESAPAVAWATIPIAPPTLFQVTGRITASHQ